MKLSIPTTHPAIKANVKAGYVMSSRGRVADQDKLLHDRFYFHPESKEIFGTVFCLYSEDGDNFVELLFMKDGTTSISMFSRN